MEWYSPYTDLKYYHPYACTGIDNNILEFDLENVARILPDKPASAVETATTRVNQHYIKSQRHIKRAFGSKMVENFQQYNWGLVLNVEIGLARDKIELLNLIFSSDSEAKLTEKEFYKIVSFHSSYRKMTGRRKKVVFRDVKMCFKKLAVKLPYCPNSVTKFDALEILETTGIDLDIDFDRLTRSLKSNDAEYDRMHMLLMDDPLVSGKISGNFNKPKFRIPAGTIESRGDKPLEWIGSESEDSEEEEDPVLAFERAISHEERVYGELHAEMERVKKEVGEESTALNTGPVEEVDDDLSPTKKKMPKTITGGKTKYDMYRNAPPKKRSAHHFAQTDEATEALFAKVPKSLSATTPASGGAIKTIPAKSEPPHPSKRNGVRHKIAMAHAYGKKQQPERIELFIPNLPFAKKSIPDEKFKSEVEAVLNDADKEIRAEIELARRYAFGDSSGGEEKMSDAIASEDLPAMDASNETCYPGSALIAPAPMAENNKIIPVAKISTSAQIMNHASPAQKRNPLFGQKPKRDFLADSSSLTQETYKKSKLKLPDKPKPSRQVAFNEIVVVDDVSLASSTTHDTVDTAVMDFELLPAAKTHGSGGGLSVASTVADNVAPASNIPARPPPKKPPAGQGILAKHSGHEKAPTKEVPLKDSSMKNLDEMHQKSSFDLTTAVAAPVVKHVESTKFKDPEEKGVEKPSNGEQPVAESAVGKHSDSKRQKVSGKEVATLELPVTKKKPVAHRSASPDRPAIVEETDAVKFLSLLEEQSKRIKLDPLHARPKTAVREKAPTTPGQSPQPTLQRPKTAPKIHAALSAEEEEEYGSFLELLENYPGELTGVPPQVDKKQTKDTAVVVEGLPPVQEKRDMIELRPKSSGRSRSTVYLSPRSQAILDQPPKDPTPRAFEILDLSEPIVVPFLLSDLYAMPAQDIEVMVPKSNNGQLRLQIRHDDEGSIHGLFVHGFRPNCKAEELGLIKVGDELLRVNGKVVKGGYLEDVVEALKDHNEDEVLMTIRRHMLPSIGQSPRDFSYADGRAEEEKSPRPFAVSNQPFSEEDDFPSLYDLFTLPAEDIEVMVPKTRGQLRIQLRHDDEGDIHGLFVHGFRPFSKAEEQGVLRVADEIIKVNKIVVKGGYLEDVVDILKDHSEEYVSMTVRRFSADMRPGSRGSQVEHYRTEEFSPRAYEVTNFVAVDGSFPPLAVLFSLPSKDMKISVPKTHGQLRIQLRHDDEGDMHGLFVHGFRPFSKAEEQGLLRIGDEILSINGVAVKGGHLEDVVEALDGHLDDCVEIEIRRHGAKDE